MVGRGVCSPRGQEAMGKNVIQGGTQKWGSGGVRRSPEGGLGQNQLRTQDLGNPGEDESPCPPNRHFSLEIEVGRHANACCRALG
jgi:hypothetical protein